MEKFFLKYDDPLADENFAKAKVFMPDIQNIQSTKKIADAHQECANLSFTDQFMVVDADAVILNTFKMTEIYDLTKDKNFVYIFAARNPVNDLEYGHGGIKIFQRKFFGNQTGVDFSTSFYGKIKSVKKTLNIHKFNTSPFHAWRTAFRECVKLSAGTIENRNVLKDQERLDIWCSKFNNVEYAEHVKSGALAGREFGIKHSGNDLLIINDFRWLYDTFENTI